MINKSYIRFRSTDLQKTFDDLSEAFNLPPRLITNFGEAIQTSGRPRLAKKRPPQSEKNALRQSKRYLERMYASSRRLIKI